MTALKSISFLTPGNYLDSAPGQGLGETLELFELAEELGYNGAWVRQRHLEHGISSATVFLAAASQRTKHIELGTGVIPIGYESPFRLAEDLSTADVLSGGRLQVGLSAGTPTHIELLGEMAFDGDWRTVDFSHRRIERLFENLEGKYLGPADTVIQSPGNVQRPRLQPYSPGLRDRLWYGAGSQRSTEWAAENGANLVVGNIVAAECSDDFGEAQAGNVNSYLRDFNGEVEPRVIVGRVVLPTDSADAATRDRYREYAAGRHARTLAPQGPRRALFAPDIVGGLEEIVSALLADPVVANASEVQLNLPYEFSIGDYQQIVSDFSTLVAPALGWSSRALAATL
ncbi:Flavin-dependent oxidoreductase, luciferase family (includes alkanesulfonate monooxygenase SsuD and methylene tetrahydromethanopterin reductase) [Arthrobacter alpinus]|uniref:Flavin-dependent oxidoreductase, luciferase family (Includes alkanesulfonate monooxygenase SsuD and methylene tetrahydromethanopterin reductase) n=1 Tax=Arthrobacter alpinus TaxID=656366 RepID=A0A1H5KDE1_9MICC|nr:LLM class flavin-dependent oxidoreductase [Arthrobacter alpinus]SEE62028.1 Flavin-dependent oxidoreductase, luciferase family (includes alkanesulfonate monooxygenase SsuD and methylene tetrahydromethanopterin reductase) [Arthrobacter alpinus]